MTKQPIKTATIDDMQCPHCGEKCGCDSVDVGVGVGVGMIFGPWGCPNCGWSEDPKYDSRDCIRHDGDKRVFDQYGSSHHVERFDGMLIEAGLNIGERGATGT